MTDARQATARLAVLKALKEKVTEAYNDARTEALTALDPGDRKTAVLASGRDVGTVSYVKGKTTARVADERALIEWAKTAHPGEVETVERLRESFLGLLLRRCDNVDGMAVDRDGEIVPGIEFRIGEPYVAAKQSADQLAALAEAFAAGEVTLDQVLAIEGGQ